MKTVRWEIHEDGSGTAYVFEAFEEAKRRFNSLDDLPDDIAAAIREDGRKSGELELL